MTEPTETIIELVDNIPPLYLIAAVGIGIAIGVAILLVINDAMEKRTSGEDA